MKNSIVFALLFAMILMSCNNKDTKGQITPKGYPITFHSGPSSPTLQAGQYGIISFYATSGDTALMPEPIEQELKIPLEYNKKVDLIGGLMMMGKGDSATIHIPMDVRVAFSMKLNPAPRKKRKSFALTLK